MASTRASRGRSGWVGRALVVAWVVFIWSRSLFPGPESTAQSDFFVQALAPLFSALGVETGLRSFLVRKAGHFLEYLVLGVLLQLTGRSKGGIPWQRLFFGLVVPVSDETLQLLVPGRSSQVADVLIDFAGVLVGLAVVRLRRR